jgi:hypothetical protein
MVKVAIIQIFPDFAVKDLVLKLFRIEQDDGNWMTYNIPVIDGGSYKACVAPDDWTI